jgi:ribose transport system substrate-binding protein
MIRQGYDAIVIDCASPRGLNPVIKRAMDAGIVVVTFDQVADDPDFWKIDVDYNSVGEITAKFLVAALDGKGNIVVDRGLPGSAASKLLYDSAMNVFKQYPDIKVVSEFDGMYAEGPAEQGVAAAMTANPKIDGVYSQGYTAPIGRAFLNARRPLPVIAGVAAYQSDLKFAIEHDGPVVQAYGNLTGIGAMAIQMAIDILEGNPPEKHIRLNSFHYSNRTDLASKIGVPLYPLEDAYFPALPPSFSWPVLPADFHVQLTMEEAIRPE